MSNLKQILWLDENSIPPVNYLWQKKDGIYTFSNGNWQKTKAFKSIKELSCEERLSNIAKLTNGEYADIDEVPEGVIGQNYGWVSIPNNLCLDETKTYNKYIEFNGNECKEVYHGPFLKLK